MQPTYDPLEFFLNEYETVVPAMRFSACTTADARLWQMGARAKLRALLGDLPNIAGDVPSRVIDERVFPGCTRLKLEMELTPGLLSVAYYLLPDARDERGPAVLALPGHGRSVEDLIGGPDGEGHATEYALECARAGLPTLALEQIAFGERRHRKALEENPDGGTSCNVPVGAALLLGRTLAGYRVREAMRALTWLSSRAEVDGSKLGLVGMSGGGTIAIYAAALDTRVKATVLSGSFNTYRDSIFSIFHCPDNFIPGILNWFEMPDIIGMIAPRCCFLKQGQDDPIFPVKSFHESVERARKIYGAFGVPDRMGSHVYPGGHCWNGSRGIPFLVDALRQG